jgi:sugar lactone lactonase YvrE
MSGEPDVPRREAVGEAEVVAVSPEQMWTGVTVSHGGRIFVSYPRWGDTVRFTVAELRDGEAVPYPDQPTNVFDDATVGERLVSVQSVVVDPADRLWLLDTGSVELGPTMPGGPKLVCVDLERDEISRMIHLPSDVALETSYVNDVRFDLRRGEAGMAFITDSTDSGPNGIIVVDLASGRSWRRLHDHPSTKAEDGFVAVIEGRPLDQLLMGSDGIAISHDGERLFYCPLASRRLYSVAVDALADPALPEDAVARTVVDHGDKGASDGLESDAQGRVYATNYEHGAILRRTTDGTWEPLLYDARLLFVDTLSLATDGYLYMTVNALHRQPQYQDGTDLRPRPYALLRTRVDAAPVLLRA